MKMKLNKKEKVYLRETFQNLIEQGYLDNWVKQMKKHYKKIANLKVVKGGDV